MVLFQYWHIQSNGRAGKHTRILCVSVCVCVCVSTDEQTDNKDTQFIADTMQAVSPPAEHHVLTQTLTT